MSCREEIREKRTSQFRTMMDIVMGIFYSFIGGSLVYARTFVGIEVPAWVAYILGGMMLIGGLFRLYRGIKTVAGRNNRSVAED